MHRGWFPLLDAAEIDTTGYSARDKRVHGFLAERLLDVWLAQQDYRVKELSVGASGTPALGKEDCSVPAAENGNQKRPNGAVKRVRSFC